MVNDLNTIYQVKNGLRKYARKYARVQGTIPFYFCAARSLLRL
jgi:hypothetical protein